MAPDDRRCDVSPFCGPTLDLLRAIGVSLDLPWCWCHIGPIRTDAVRIVEHRGSARHLSRALPSTGGLGRFGGYHLDLLGIASPPPGVAASYHQMLQLWYVYAVAWRDADGPRVEWRAERSGPGELTTHQRGQPTLGDADAVAGRCKDLLLGRLVQRGRPRKSEAEIHDGVELALRAAEVKEQSPRRTLAKIARDLGTDERTMRRYRAEARRLGLIADPTRRLA